MSVTFNVLQIHKTFTILDTDKMKTSFTYSRENKAFLKNIQLVTFSAITSFITYIHHSLPFSF